MLVFVYEYVSGGGWLAEEGAPPVALATEGELMRTALATDFASIEGVQVVTTRDVRVPSTTLPSQLVSDVETRVVQTTSDERSQFAELAATADWTLVVAPESGHRLIGRATRVTELGGQLLSPGVELIGLLSDKQQTARHLRRHGIPTPPGLLLRGGQSLPPGSRFRYPAVLKPLDGCGSQGLRWVEDESASLPGDGHPRRLESFCPGDPVSVLMALGGDQSILFPACRQRIAAPNQGDFRYLGGSYPLPPSAASRAARLASDTVACLPDGMGLIGLDLLLGSASDGREDLVVEVNPRCTTSYIALRAASHVNLAEVQLQLAQGERPQLQWRQGQCDFSVDGQIDWLP